MPAVSANHPTFRRRPLGRAADLASLLLLFGLMLVVTLTMGQAFQRAPDALWNPQAWRAFLAEADTAVAILLSLSIALVSTALATLLAVPLAWAAAQAHTVGRRLLLIVGAAPLVVPSSLWARLAEDLIPQLPPAVSGYPVQWPTLGLIALYAVHLSPIMLLTLTAALLRADRAQAESARCHGLGDFAAWYRMTLPQLSPALVLGGTLIALRVLADVGAPGVLGIERLLAVQAADTGAAGSYSLAGIQSALILLLICASLVVLSWRHLVGPLSATAPSPPRRPKSWPAVAAALALVVLAAISWVRPAGGITGLPPSDDFDAGVWYALLPTAAAASLALVALGFPVALLARRPGPAAAALRWALPLLLIIPTPLLAGLLYGFAGSGAEPTAGGDPWPRLLAGGMAVALPVLALVPHLTAHLAVWPDRTHGDLARCQGGSRWRPIAHWLLPAQLSVMLGLLMIGAALGLNDAATGATFMHRLTVLIPAAPSPGSITDRPVDGWPLVAAIALLALASGWVLRRRHWTDAAPSGRALRQ